MNETTRELISATIQCLFDTGHSKSTIEAYQAAYNSLVRYCDLNGIGVYNPEVGKAFLRISER